MRDSYILEVRTDPAGVGGPSAVTRAPGRTGARPSRDPRLPRRIGGRGPVARRRRRPWVSQNAGTATDRTCLPVLLSCGLRRVCFALRCRHAAEPLPSANHHADRVPAVLLLVDAALNTTTLRGTTARWHRIRLHLSDQSAKDSAARHRNEPQSVHRAVCQRLARTRCVRASSIPSHGR